MTNYQRLHEVVWVTLHSTLPRPTSELPRILTPLGFTQHDDVLCLDRSGEAAPWQASSIVSVKVLLDGKEVFDFDAEPWNEIRLEYLFASLPYECTAVYFDAIEMIGRHLGMKAVFCGAEVTSESLQLAFDAMREEVLDETGEDVGSEALAILIYSTYPRR